MKNLTKDQLIIIVVSLCIGWAFTLGMTTVVGGILTNNCKKQLDTIGKLSRENKMLLIEVKGLTRLIKIKDDQSICHYTHTEVKHDFRVINKR